jgi:hypothetical protein
MLSGDLRLFLAAMTGALLPPLGGGRQGTTSFLALAGDAQLGWPHRAHRCSGKSRVVGSFG